MYSRVNTVYGYAIQMFSICKGLAVCIVVGIQHYYVCVQVYTLHKNKHACALQATPICNLVRNLIHSESHTVCYNVWKTLAFFLLLVKVLHNVCAVFPLPLSWRGAAPHERSPAPPPEIQGVSKKKRNYNLIFYYYNLFIYIAPNCN